ncbi:DUF1642 domain-containing protein [Enterococcus casseliflavus]|uniref:DUF1642 domain-containing protein n=1 Tax=Enterococcus casseliflavus TaxID=37734 RepID=UPI003A4C5789
MNKQELTEMVKNAEVAAQTEINLIRRYKDEDSDYQRGRRNAYRDVATWIKDLDKVQKVMVPQFVADWIEHCKENATLTDCLKGYYEISDGEGAGSTDFQNWVVDNENDELTAKAWMFGYEVEKEPNFIVKVGNLYLIEPLGDTSDSTIRTTWNHKNAYEFTSYNMAQTHANKFGGEVEEVK